MNIFQSLNEVLVSVLEAVIILLLFIFLINKKSFLIENKFKSLIFILLYTIFSYWASTYLPSGFHSICITIFLIVVLAFIVPCNIYVSTIAVAITGILTVAIEGVIFIVEMAILKVDINMIMDTMYLKIFHNIICTLVKFGSIYVLYHLKFNLFKMNIFKKENSSLSFIILQIFMMSIFIFSANYVVSHQTNIMLYNILLFIIYLLFITLAYLDYRERERILIIQHKFEAQNEYVKNMETVMNVIRREKHDFANHLNTLLAISVLKKSNGMEKIGDYIRKLTHNMNASYRVFHTGNDYVDGLLAVKNHYAFEHDIHFEVDIEAPLNIAQVDDNHLTSIIGNIVDNAFEAILAQYDKEDKVVSLCTYIEGKAYYLSIADNGPMIPEEIKNKIFDNGFSTKDNNKPDHGFGLFIVNELIKQHSGEIKVLSSEEETEFLIKFKVRKDKDAKDCSKDYKRDTA